MSGSAPTPRLFGSDNARVAQNPRSEDQMQPAAGGGRNLVGGGAGGDWWTRAPERTSLATTTGQNLEGTTNAFDTNFWDTARRQDEEQKTLAGRWSRDDATGIVTYDSDREGVEFGDVFVGGQKAGNIYRGYAGMTNTDGDEIMARLILPREVWAKAYESEAGKPLTFAGSLSDEIQAARGKRSEDFEKGMSAAEFEGEVVERAKGMEGSGAWQASNVAAGVAGGTVTGLGIAAAATAVTAGAAAPLAPFIVAGGALAGGIGSYLNRDEAFRDYAQALEMWESATEDGHQAIGYADAAAGFVGAAANKLNVTRNLLHGGYDAAYGQIGDQSSAYYDTETPLWMQGADMGALLIDGVGSFGSATARRVYTTLMGTTAAAEQTSVALGAAEGNTAFNPYTGAYEDIGVGGTLQRQASVGIDIAQTAAAHSLGRLLNRRAAAADSYSRGGWVVQTVEGTQQATRLGFSALIPSEAVAGLAARTMARRSVRTMGLEASQQNLAIQTARHLENLTTGRKSIAVMAVNGFGEGAEEFVQAALGATAYGEVPTFRELVEASKQGFAMGVGMGGALAAGSRSRTQMYLDRANVMRAVRGQDEYTPQQWAQFTESEQAQAGTASDQKEQALYDMTVRRLVIEGSRVAGANMVELRRAVEVARQITEQEQRNSQDLVETSRLQVRSNHEWGPQDYVVSLGAAIRDVEARAELMQRTAGGAAIRGRNGQDLGITDEERSQAAQIAEADQALLQRLRQAQAVVEQTPELAPDEIATLNAELQAWWNATDELAYGKRRSASVWGARYPLNAAGSFQLLRLQVSPELTLSGDAQANWTALVPDEILAPTGGDFDGDRFVTLLRELLPEQSYEMQRWGAGQLTSDGTMLSAKPYLVAQTAILFDDLQRPGTTGYNAALAATGRLRSRLNSILSRSSMPATIRMKLVNQFVLGLSQRNTGAVKRLFDTLATQHAPAMRELAQQLDGSPWLAMNRVIEDEMRVYQNARALTTEATTRSGQTPLLETSKNMPRWPARQVRQTSDLLQGATVANKYDIFRLQTVLKYNSRREATQTTPEETADQLAELFRTFTARNDGMVRPGEDALFDGTIAQDRVIRWLQAIAAEYAQTFSPSVTTNEALVLLAGADVDDIDWQTRRPRSSRDVRLIQVLLREVVTRLRSEYAEVLGRDQAIAGRLNSLDSLTTPDFMDGTHTHAQGGDAFVEVLGSMPIYELIGEQGANVNTWTVRGLRDYLIGLRGDVREEVVASLERHPSYRPDEDGSPSPYRVLIDNVVESARMQLSESRETGLPTGALTRSSTTATANFTTIHDSLRKVLRARGIDPNSAAALRDALANDTRLSTAILQLVEERGVQAGVVQRDRTGNVERVQFPQWIYDVFAEPSTARAEMVLLRQTLVMARANLLAQERLDVYKTNDRILRLWLDLDYRADSMGPDSVAAGAARDAFLQLLEQSDTVEAFISGLNLDLRFRDERTPPYIAWARDRSLVEASRFGEGVSEVQEGTGMRDALRDAASVAAAVLHDEEAIADYFEDNQELLAQLRAARDAADGAVGSDLWQRFVSWFNLAKDLPTMVGVSVWINQAGHINEILGNMGVKGISPENVAPLGKAIAAQLPTFDSAVGQLLGSLTSGSLGSVLTDATQLARGERTIVLNDGTVVDWEGMTPERALDLLSDPNTAGVASRMLGMTAWDYNEDLNQNILVSIVGKGVAGFTADPAESLFGRDQTSKFRRLMTLESMATTPGGTPIIPLILAVQMNIREAALDHPISDKTGERQAMAVSILEELADALDALSRVEGLYARVPAGELPFLSPAVDELTGEDSNRLNQALLTVARRAVQEKGVGNSVASLLSSDPNLRDIGHELLRRWAANFSRNAVASGDPVLKKAAEKLVRDLNTVDDFASPLDVLLETYGRFDDPTVQELLVRHVRGAGDIVNAAAWARDELLRVQDPDTPTVVVRMGEGELVLPNLTKQQWETVARAVIAFTMHTEYGVATRSDTEISVFPSLTKKGELDAQRSFWDPTFVEPMLDIFAPGLRRDPAAKPSPLLAAQLELVRTMGPQLPVTTVAEAEAAVYRFVEPQITNPEGRTRGTTGQWHALLPALMHSAQGAVLASSAESGIQMAGLSPDRLAFLAATTRQDWSARPQDTELSLTTFPADQLITAVAQGQELSSAIDIAIAGRQDPQQRVLAQLEGRVVRRLSITVAGQTYPLLGDQRYASGMLLPSETGVLAGEGGVLSLKTLQSAVTSWLRDNSVPANQWGDAQIEVAFYHPDTKAVAQLRAPGAQYSHSPWFDGVGGRTDAAFSQQSLVGSFFFGLDGVVPGAYEQALGAIKKLTFALQQVTRMPESRRKALINDGLLDMSGMLDRLTDFAMRQKIDGKALPLTSYNAVRKILSLLYVVRYVDENGSPVVLSSEEVIARQMRGETFELGSAEVVGLPMQHVLALMGEQGAADMVVTPWGELLYSPDVARAQQYLHFPSHAWTEMFPGLVRAVRDAEGNFVSWATADLLEQPALQNQALPRARVQSRQGQTAFASRDFFGPYRKHQERVHAERGQRQGATTHWAEQRAAQWSRLGQQDLNIGQRVLQAVQFAAEGNSVDSAGLLNRRVPDVAPTNDFTTGWTYVHLGAREGGVVKGILHSVEEIGQNATLGDDVIIEASTFVPEQGGYDPAEAFGEARVVLNELMAVGATIHLPTSSVAPDLRRQMASYLREHDYSETVRGSGSFVPQARAVIPQQTAAFHATLNGATQRTSRNRVLLDLSDYNPINENSIYSVNGGLGALETYDVREVIQTARYAGYGPQLSPENSQREHLIDTLLPVLRSPAGREYLIMQSGIAPDDREGLKEIARALDLLESKLIDARGNARAKLLPEPGQEFGTGDLIPLVSYNDRNELVGVHLYRHGHEPADERLLFGASLPEGNAALGANGVRLTIDSGTVDAKHTTHRGEVVEFKWRSLQGAVMRIRTTLSDLGSKVFEVGTGMKWTTTPAPENLPIPQHAIFAGRPVLGAADLASPAAKTADGGWLNTPSRIIEAVGFDVTPYLVRLLRGVELERDGAAAFAAAENEVRALLGRFRAEHAGSVDAATLITRSTDEFSQVLREQLAARLAELLDTEVPSFYGPVTPTQLVDATLTQFVLSSLSAGASLDEVLGAPGYIGAQTGTASHTMHPVFTTLLHQLPNTHPARLAFVDQINARMPWDGPNGYELRPDFTWVRHITGDNGSFQIPAMLAFPVLRNTDTNDALSEMATERKQRGSVSGTTLAMAYTTWAATPLLDQPLQRGSSVFEPNQFLHDGETGGRAFFFNPGVNASPFTPRMDDDLRMNAAEARHIFGTALPRRRALSVPIETEHWYADLSKEQRRQQAAAYDRAFAATLRDLRLTKQDSVYLTEMLRAVVARPATAPGSPEYMTYREALAGLKLIQANARRGDMPTHGGAVNVVSRAALARLHEVGYPLRPGNGTNRPLDGWDDWVDAMLAEAFSNDVTMRGYPAVSNIVDGLLYEYRGDVKGLPATTNTRRQGILSAIRSRSGLLVTSPVLRRQFDMPGAQDGEVIYDVDGYSSTDWEFEELPQDARAIVEKRMTTWENQSGLRRKRQSPRQEAIRGVEIREDLARTNVVMRFAQLGIVLKSLVNPGLWVSAFVELGLKGVQERAVSFLAGENLHAQGFTEAQRQQWNDTVSKLAQNPTFYGMVYAHTNYNPEGRPETRVEERLQRFTNMATAMFNDPTWGISSKAMARTFMEAAWDSVSKFSRDRNVTIEQFLDTLAADPEALNQISTDAVAHGYSRIEYRRNLQDNLAERARRTLVEGIINSGGPGVNTLGTLFLRFPTLFFRFRSNTLINLLGLQGPHAALAALMSDRTRRGGGLFAPRGPSAAAAGEEVSEQARIEDSYDLTRAMIRTGVSHTQLLMLGMALSAAGFGGEDDEEKLLNKLRRYQVPLTAKDPLALENDFRNAEAWFSELLPAGLGVPSWVIRPFVSPAMGIARFHETGDWRQVLWGFTDALGNLPLLNVDSVMNSWTIANELVAAAEATSQDESDEATAKASRLLFTAVGTLEAMLFESAFASMVYQGADEWDRDPYKMPLLDSDGDVQRFANGLPRPAEMLNEFTDPETGEVRQGYAQRNDTDAMLRALAENRPVLATLMSMIMHDSSFIRYNMVPKTREIDAQELTQEEATQIVVSTFTNEAGEVLTQDGAAGVIRGIHLGTVSLEDPALQGIFIPQEMRIEIQKQLLGELTEKYVYLGYSKQEALTNAKAEFYGQAYGEPEGLGIADILWSDKIPGWQKQIYLQLNTTYVMGPNGSPIATGLRRNVLDAVGMNLEGLGVFQTYEAGQATNMTTDQLLNVQDAGRGMNLGQRALVKVDESWIPPTDEEIGESITDALAEISDQLDDLNDTLDGSWGRGYGGGRRYGRGGGGGGGGGYRANYGGQAVRLNTPRGFDQPYALSPRTVNTSNPIIRRATVRRERFSSERGRLNQWQ